MKNLVRFLTGSSRRMNFITRFNTRIKTYGEPVSAHSFYVTMYVYIIGNVMKRRGFPVDISLAMKKALFHDLEECMAGDILTPFKVKFEKEYESLCVVAMDEILKDLDRQTSLNIRDHWKTAKEGLEGQLVNFCDDLAGLIYCHEQIMTGNAYFRDIAEDYLDRLKASGEKNRIFKEIAEEL